LQKLAKNVSKIFTMKNQYFPSPHADMEAQVEAAWGDVSLFLFSKQADLAYPETKISAQETFGDKIQEWANAIIDLAARNKDLALGYIDDALRDAKSFRDMQKYKGLAQIRG
jgi:hypothetical protein